LIGNFNPLSSRDDVGQLWENFLFMERLKKHTYQDVYAHYYFWRTWEQKEIDLVEDRGGKLYGYEFTWGKEKTAKPQVFLDAYPGSTYQLINRDNFLDFVT
jgi:predicted AAA+ superfamily ATPase